MADPSQDYYEVLQVSANADPDTIHRVYRLLAEYLADVGEKITPEAYHVTAAPARKLSPAVTLARVAIVGVGILFLYYAITWLMWARSVDELRTVVQGMGLV